MNLSIIIPTKNTEGKIADCLKSVKGMGEIIVLDGGSTDKTVEIAKEAGARIAKQKQGSYAVWRNQGAGLARGDWLFYIDSDERTTLQLREEILQITAGPAAVLPPRIPTRGPFLGVPLTALPVAAYAIPRRNFVFGKELKHGGWCPDYVLRLIRRDKLVRWEGELHEQPKISGEVGYLKEALIHIKEDNLSDMVVKTNKWSEVEARLLLDSGHPKMAWWRFLRPVATEIFDRLVLKLGFLDGVPGIIFSVYQGYSVFMRYAKLWEMQRRSK